MEVLQDATSEATLDGWPAPDDYPLMRTTPSSYAMQSDFSGFEGYPTLPLIDLQTMAVLESDCWYASSYAACIEEHL